MTLRYDADTIYVGGEVDIMTHVMLSSAIRQTIEQYGRITIDMADVTFIDSMGLLALITAVKMVTKENRRLQSLHRQVRRVLTISGIGGLFEGWEAERLKGEHQNGGG